MITLDTILLDNFMWVDEFAAVPVAASEKRALNGAPHIEKTLLTDRPATFYCQLVPAALFKQVLNHAQTQLESFALNVRGTNYTAVWEHAINPIAGEPLEAYTDAEPDYFSDVTLKLRII